VLKSLSESLRLEYAQFLELEVFTRFGSMVDERTRKTIGHGRRIRAVLGQRQFSPLALGEQVALLSALAHGLLDDIPLDLVQEFQTKLRSWLTEEFPEAMMLDDQMQALSDECRAQLKATLSALVRAVLEAAAPRAF
jgi:F0F1-type ATP synthase alpha subunit